MQALLGDAYDAYKACYNDPRYYGLRVNTLKISVEDFLKICPFPVRPIPWIENGFYYDGDAVRPARDPYYFAGLYYLQEPSAMTPANRLPVNPGDRVLDLCAAPGGKATELGARLKGQGLLVANDISASRAKGLLKNIELFGIANSFVLSAEPAKLADYFPAYFDKILIDAPCSGEGMFRKDPKMVKAWEEHGPEFFSALQETIVEEAYKMLRPGGEMLYSTCTFDAQENECRIGTLLERHPDMHVQAIVPYDGFAKGRPELYQDCEDLSKTVRIFPHKMAGEGHYLALLKKEGTCVRKEKKTKVKNARLPEEARDFLEKVTLPFEGTMEVHGNLVYLMPEGAPKITGVRFLRTGLFLGEIKKKRFEPSQSLALAITSEAFDNVIDFHRDDPRVKRYLKGETLVLDAPEKKGWCLICVDGYPLGWGKNQGTTVKNKYFAGWRWMGE